MAVVNRKRRRNEQYAYVENELDKKKVNAMKVNEFYQNLNGFYRRKWGANLKLPNVDGFPFDLCTLYDIVIENGGWQKVSSQEQWGEVAAALGFNHEITVVSHAIKMIYLRYLSKYEQNEVIGEPEEMDAEGMAGRNRNGRMFFTYLATSDCPVSLPPMTTEPSHYAATTESEYSRLAKSLMSGLPNEVDFAINILTLLSHPGPRLFKVSSCPNMVTILMAHVGVFTDNEKMLNHLHYAWQVASGRDFVNFWKGAGITDPEILRLAGFSQSEVLEQFHRDRDLFNLPLAEFSTSDPISWRIFQVLCIVRNLSFEEVNKTSLAENWPLVKFLLICAACEWPQLINSSLDALSNISYELDMSSGDLQVSYHALLKIANDCISSGDRFKVMRGMEIISGLCNCERNENILCEFLNDKVMAQIFSGVCMKDVMITVYTLEALYEISELGSIACDQICRFPHAIDMLVHMTTVETMSFGPNGLAGMKVVEFNGPSGGSAGTSTATAPATPRVQPAPTTTTNTVPRTIMSTSSPHVDNSVLQSVPQSPTLTNGQPQQVDPQQSKVDVLTRKWIRKNCVATAGSTISRGEVYAAYVADMRAIHNSLSMSVMAFSNTLQQIFPELEVRPCPKQGSSFGFTFVGIKFIKDSRQQTASPSQESESNPALSSSPVRRSVSESHSPSPLSEYNGDEDDPMHSPVVIGQPRPSTDSQDSVDIVAHASHVKLEVCSAAVEARNILMTDNRAHETKIVRVENIACRMPLPNSAENHNPGILNEDQISIDEVSEKLDLTIDAVASGKNGINGQPNCNGVCYKHVNGLGSEHENENGMLDEQEDEEMEDEMDDEAEDEHYVDEEEGEGDDMVAEDEDDETSSMCSESVQSSVNGVLSHMQPSDLHSNGLDSQLVYSNGHFSASESESTAAEAVPDVDASTSEDGGATSSALTCEWDNCQRTFQSGSSLFYHCATEHISESTVQCKWPNCDNTLRSRWSLVTHVQDHHCNEAVIKHAASSKPRQDSVSGDQPEATHKFVREAQQPCYTKNAAAEAIRRHAFTFLPKDVTDETEGPVTKSIRLTSSLILRNLARYSSDGRRLLRRHESHLSWLALSKLESGTALAQCLAELHESQIVA